MTSPAADRFRLSNLLIARATRGLSAREHEELDWFLAAGHPAEAHELDTAVALLDVAYAELRPQTLPADLRRRLLEQGEAFVSAGLVPPLVAPLTAQAALRTAAVQPRDRSVRAREAIAWFAALAALLLAVVLWRSPVRPSQVPTLAEQLRVLEGAPDLMRITMTPPSGEDAAGVTGEALWSDSRQQGFVICSGLPPNDPAREQYQLWVIDRRPGLEQRVDGGVFDISPSAEPAIIPISAKLKIFEAQGFAVTVEQPGGVVVSDLQRIALINLGNDDGTR